MKFSYKLLIIGALPCLFLASCSKDSADPIVAASGGMAAKIDGVEWKATGAATILNGAITIAGQDADNKGLQLGVLKSIVKGTYDVKGPEASLPDASLSLTPPGELALASSYYAAGVKVGTITIAEIDETNKTISGTFSGKVKRLLPEEKEIEIKSGTFNKVPYTTQVGAGPSANTFNAKVAGTSLNATVIGGVKALSKITLNFSTADAKKIISITVPSTVTTGTNSFGNFGSTYFATYTLNSSVYESVSGSVNITEHNATSKLIKGTFNFSAEPFPLGGTPIAITEGAFSVTYN